jgi:hypothetical protein
MSLHSLKPHAVKIARAREVTRLRAALERVSRNYADAYHQLTELTHGFQDEVAVALQDRLNSHLGTLPQDSYSDKQRLASFVNQELRELGLIRAGATGLPTQRR